MTPLPPPLGTGELVAWRLDRAQYAATWDSGEGAYRAGGRWNPKGFRAVYCALDPATAILEVAVHTGFEVLDTIPHVLTSIRVTPEEAHVVEPQDVPNREWLRPGAHGAGQQAFGAQLMRTCPFVLIPSTVSSHSWNLIFEPARAMGRYTLEAQEAFALDPRLNVAA